jgi:cytoplasmic iron level regulating protein YaaA (DUF328/UPF0246 family)
MAESIRSIAFISCVSKKTKESNMAQYLYNSPLFKKAALYAQKVASEWYILSAKYGLLHPKSVIEPYDETLNDMHSKELNKWSNVVLTDIWEKLKPKSGDKIIFLAGNKYRKLLIEPLKNAGLEIVIPMEGLPIGKQISWLGKQIESLQE